MKTLEQLAGDFDAAILRHGPAEVSRPTPGSIENINAHFGIVLPAQLIDFAHRAKCFGNWFAGLGDDFGSPHHIVRINSYWRRRRPKRAIPRNLVVINIGFDEDLDCLDTSSFDTASGEYAIQYWYPGIDESDMRQQRYETFGQYIETHINDWGEAKGNR